MPGWHGLVRKRWATGIARSVASRPAWPVRMMRTTSGWRSCTCDSSEAPSMPGMRMSETMTSKCCSPSNFSACSPLSTNTISHRSLLSMSTRCRPESTSGSSSTNMMCFSASLMCGSFPLEQRQAHVERRALPHRGFEEQLAAVLLHHDAAREREALPRALADLLGGEERIHHAVPDLLRDAAAVVADPQLDPARDLLGLDPDAALWRGALAAVARLDRVRGVHDQVDQRLPELLRVALDDGQVVRELELERRVVAP